MNIYKVTYSQKRNGKFFKKNKEHYEKAPSEMDAADRVLFMKSSNILAIHAYVHDVELVEEE